MYGKESVCYREDSLIRPRQEQNNDMVCEEEIPNYTLMSADLRRIPSLNKTFSQSSFNSTLPIHFKVK